MKVSLLFAVVVALLLLSFSALLTGLFGLSLVDTSECAL
jgi:hypothetical protein